MEKEHDLPFERKPSCSTVSGVFVDRGKRLNAPWTMKAAARGAMNDLMAEVVENHIREHVASPAIPSDAEGTRGADELVEIVPSYLR